MFLGHSTYGKPQERLFDSLKFQSYLGGVVMSGVEMRVEVMSCVVPSGVVMTSVVFSDVVISGDKWCDDDK